jgi:hypothetical protein
MLDGVACGVLWCGCMEGLDASLFLSIVSLSMVLEVFRVYCSRAMLVRLCQKTGEYLRRRDCRLCSVTDATSCTRYLGSYYRRRHEHV